MLVRACEIPRSVSITVNNFFQRISAEMISVECVAFFWVVNASSGEKSCLQFSIPTGSGVGGEGGVSHGLNIYSSSARKVAWDYAGQCQCA